MAAIGGTIYVKRDGNLLRAAAEDWEYDLGLPTREVQMGADGTVLGYSEEFRPSKLSGTIVDDAAAPLSDLLSLSGETITLELGRKTIVFRNAFQAAAGAADPRSGKVKVEFLADSPAEEVF